MHKDPAAFNAYHREYQLRRYHRRRKQALKQLGGKCRECGRKRGLQFDHIDSRSKSFSITKMWSAPEEKFQAELKKCQLLCTPCHLFKTVDDAGNTHRKTKDEIAMKFDSPKPPKKTPS